MRSEVINELQLWRFENLSSLDSIGHYVSDRNAARGEGEFTLSLSSSPDKEFVQRNRAELAEALGIKSSKMYFPSQIHGTRIVRITPSTEKDDLQNTDALITNEKNVCISVMSADCVPILIYDKANHAAAAVHAGWRGTVSRIIEKTLVRMQTEFGTQGKDIVAGIGPSVSPEVYEVGADVAQSVIAAFGGASARLLIPLDNGKSKLDLWNSNAIQLLEFGVPHAQIEISNLCTILNNDSFFSARKGDPGRFAAGIFLK